MSTARASASVADPAARVRWGMVFDLDRCIGCQTCTIACKQTNQTPPGVLWRNVLDLEVGEYPEVDRTFLLTGCHHCDEPPCVPVCPTGATWRRDDGLVVIDDDVCIGCGSCVVGCPYQARTIVRDRRTYFGGAPMPTETRTATLRRHGVAQKCTFCKDRIDDGLARGLRPGVDPDATPACANACISKAITFGDLADPGDTASRLLAASGGRRMHPELGTRSHIFYLGERRANVPQPGPVQTVWDVRAAMNFVLGGMASGLFLAAACGALLFGLERGPRLALELVAGALMAAGLGFVFLKLGRKLRFWRVATRWQSSWMTREAYCAGAVFAGLLADLAGAGALAALLTAVGAAGFLYCQAHILHAAKGIPAWREARVPGLLMSTGILEGVGLAVAGGLLFDYPPAFTRSLAIAGAVAAGMLALTWRGYVDGIRAASRGALDALAPIVVPIGQIAPGILFLVLAFAPEASWARALAAAGGLAAVLAGGAWKYVLVVRAGRFQGVRIPDATLAPVTCSTT